MDEYTHLPRGKAIERTPGTWAPMRFVNTIHVSAWMYCPKCGQGSALAGHRIHDSGAVEPEIDCPWEGCGFSAWVFLDGWSER